ncbi:MAG: PPC domain-containing DNA-binding protein [Geobacteraceae bacterium]|nr:PPC domain-containing DNA-binding protein [Geobacteraceae bacterium]
MKYQCGKMGRVFIVRFEDGDDVLGGLVEMASREGIDSAAFHLVGGMKRGRFVVGPEREELPPVPVWREFGDSHEILGFGTIFRHGDQPKVHFHGAFGKKDAVRVGCLREASEAFLVLEAVVQEIVGVTARREMDPESGMVLLKI